MSGNELKGVPIRFTKTETPETKYTAAEYAYADRYGGHVVQAKNWRFACIISLCSSLLLIASNVYFATLPQVVPYIVEVDGQTGALLGVTKSTEKSAPNENVIACFLWDVVKKSRTIPKDSVVYENNWNDVYTFLNEETANKMNEFAIKSKHKEKLEQGMTTQLTMKSFMRTKENTYQIRWKEVLYDASGRAKAEEDLEGLFQLIQTKTDEKAIYINPLGLIITDFNWSQER